MYFYEARRAAALRSAAALSRRSELSTPRA
jgi:hypothetical protein